MTLFSCPYEPGRGLGSAVLSGAEELALLEALDMGKPIANKVCSDITTPFGGFKQSGFGRDRSLHALDKYTELKTIWLKLSGKA